MTYKPYGMFVFLLGSEEGGDLQTLWYARFVLETEPRRPEHDF